MSEQIKEAYDAFISYRHSELDMFVASQIHKELEAFRLPKNLIRDHKIKGKTKITRIFRDKEELPLSTNLSDPILRALEVSEYLIVICTPRLPQSIWCQREIENFIKLHGRERVLAVLAEGEPEESFPEILCYREKTIVTENGEKKTIREDLEPLAADVRGRNKLEVKKRIKEEIVRLAAAMFQCAYDDLRQRHREQRLKKRFQISMGISAVLLAFGCVSCYQALEIKHQYLENKKAQSEIMAASAKEKLEQGERLAAIEYASMALPDNLSKPEYPVNGQAVRTLTEALRVYDNGSKLRADTYLEQEADIDYILPLGENMLMTVDTYDTLTFWNLENNTCVSSCDTQGFYNAYYGKFCKLSSDMFFFLDAEGLHSLDINTGKKIWDYPTDNGLMLNCISAKNQLILVCDGKIQLIDNKTGKLVNEVSLWEKNIDTSPEAVGLSKDESKCYVGIKQKDSVTIVVLDTNTLQVEQHLLENMDNICDMSLNETGDVLLVAYRQRAKEDYLSYGSSILAYSTKDFKVKWAYDTDEFTQKLGWLPDDTALIQNSNSVVKLDATNGQCKASESFDCSIKNIYTYSDGRLLILLKDGSILFQELDSFSFMNFVDKYHILDDWLEDFIYMDGKYITLNPFEKRLLIYDIGISDKLKETEFTKETLEISEAKKNEFVSGKEVCKSQKQSATCDIKKGQITIKNTDTQKVIGNYPCKTKYVKKMCFTNDEKLLLIQYEDDSLDIVDSYTCTLNNQYDDIEELNECTDMDENYFVISGISNGYVLDKNTLSLIADIQGFLSYDENKKTFLVSAAQDKVYEVPFYSLEKLMDIAEKELNQ